MRTRRLNRPPEWVQNTAIVLLLIIGATVIVMMFLLMEMWIRSDWDDHKCIRSDKWIECTDKSFLAADLEKISLINESGYDTRIATLKGSFGEIGVTISDRYYNETMKVLETAIDENKGDQ